MNLSREYRSQNKIQSLTRNENRPFFPKKYLGQNFLVDPHVCQKIINACDLKSEDVVLEIGPGKGMLTQHIAANVKRVIAIEKDKTLVDHLRKNFAQSSVEIIHADILDYSFELLPGNLKVIGNLPYNIATAIVEKIINHSSQCRIFYMTVQLEHGLRMAAAANSKDYGSFSCFVQYHAQVKKLFNIKNTAFRPIPKVQSCFLRLDILPLPRHKVLNEHFLFDFIQTAFQQRRKAIVNSLSSKIEKEKLLKILESLNIKPNLRAENLSLEDYIAITNILRE